MKRKVKPSLIDRRRIRLRRFWIRCAVLTPFAAYVSFCISGTYVYQESILEAGVWNVLQWCLTHPFLCYNDKTMPVLLTGLLLWTLAMVSLYVRMDNTFAHGAEHGVAEWGQVKEFNQKYSNKEHPEENRILSENVRFSYDSSTLRNNNMFVVGGSGAGKTSFLLTPNLLNNYGCNVYTDPKGTLLEELGGYLEHQPDTNVYQLNMCEPEKSMKFNPFEYIKNTFDLTKLITNFIQNTDDEAAKKSPSPDPFWPKAERLFFKSIFLYVWMECPKIERNDITGEFITLHRDWSSVLTLLEEAHFSPDPKIPPRLDERMFSLPPNHPARRTYEKYRGGADETIRSIVLTADARMEPFYTPEIINIFCGNEIPLDHFGVGVNGNQKTKSDLFIVIPDDDDTFNFVPGIVYTMLFQLMNHQARFYGGKLPMDVGVWLDEFANIKMPNNFDKILATCRSRRIYCCLFLQSLAQMKTLFAEGAWEGLIGNCDTFIYLGGNEQSTFKYVSELLGEWTMDKKTNGENKGPNGSSSENRDVLGRKLMDEYEMRLLPNDECIIFVRGEKALRDKKWFPWDHEEYKKAIGFGKYDYNSPHNEPDERGFEFLDNKSLDYFKRQSEKDKNVKVVPIDPYDFMFMDLDALLDCKESSGRSPVFDLEKLQKMYQEDREAKEREELEQYVNSYDTMQLFEVYASPRMNPLRKRIIRDMNKKNIKEEDIKHIVHPLLSDEEVIAKRDAYYEMCGFVQK